MSRIVKDYGNDVIWAIGRPHDRPPEAIRIFYGEVAIRISTRELLTAAFNEITSKVTEAKE